MIIYSVVNKNSQNQNFTGLTRCFKKKIFLDGQRDIEKILAKHPNSRPIVGQLPKYIYSKLPEDKGLRSKAIHEILDAFGKVATIIRDYRYPGFSLDESIMNRPVTVNEILNEVFHKWDITKENIDIMYLNKGGKGKGFKIDGLYDPETEDEYVIKVFHQIKGECWQSYKSHGCYAEINNAMYWKKQEGLDTNRGKFYFGDMGSGYMLTKYISEDTQIAKRIPDPFQYGIICTDENKVTGQNYLKGYAYDYGGLRVVNRIKNSNPTARKIYQKIKSTPKTDREIIGIHLLATQRKNRENIIAGVALGIKYLEYKNFYIDTCLKENSPVINKALAYVLKYLPHEDAIKYFEILLQTKDPETQTILFNEIPLLSKKIEYKEGLEDALCYSRNTVYADHVYEFYMLGEKYAVPEAVEHLGSFVHMLPLDKRKQQYIKLTNIDNYDLQDRLIWKLHLLDEEMQEYAISKLSKKVKDIKLQKSLDNFAQNFYERKINNIRKDIYAPKP